MNDMKISLVNSPDVSRLVKRLIAKHDRIYMAVAWGGMIDAANTLLGNQAKFASVLFGLDFCSTDPDLVDKLIDVKNAYVAKNRSGCFHPKIFLFESDDKSDAIVGSANFTAGGFGSNLEAGIHISGKSDLEIFAEIKAELESYEQLRQPVTDKIAASYRRQFEAASSRPRPKHPVLPSEKKQWAGVNALLVTKTWAEYVKEVRDDHHHDFDRRMALLRFVQGLLSKTSSFATLPVPAWKGIAGAISEADAAALTRQNLDWGWFGTMGAAGGFASEIGRRNRYIAQAVDVIPRVGIVTKSDYQNFCELFLKAFDETERAGGVASATRLLTMKRPDIFVGANGPNSKKLASGLSFAPTTLSLDNYWERVIELIRQSSWYTAPRPNGPEGELWDFRAAMLDAICYEPTKQHLKKMNENAKK